LDVWAGSFDVAVPVDATINQVRFKSVNKQTTAPNGEVPGAQWYAVLRRNLNNIVSPTPQFGGSISYMTDTDTWANDPATNQPWTPGSLAMINGIGVTKTDTSIAAGEVRITRAWMEVDWTAFVPPPPPAPLTSEEMKIVIRLLTVKHLGITTQSQLALFDSLIARATYNGQSIQWFYDSTESYDIPREQPFPRRAR